MSAEATFWAWKQQGISATAKLVLLCLADCHNADTGRCDPSAKYIADKSELNIKTIPVALKKLEDFGLIIIEKRSGHSPNYRLNISQNWDSPKSGRSNVPAPRSLPKNGYTQKWGTPKTGYPKTGVEGTPKTGKGGHPKLGNEPIREPKKNLKELYDPNVHGIPGTINPEPWLEWVAARKARGKPITLAAARKQVKFLAGYDPSTQTQIIDQSIANDYQGLFPPRGANHAVSQSPFSRRSELASHYTDFAKATDF